MKVTFFAFTIKIRGKSPIKHGIHEVSVCIGDPNGNINQRHKWHVAPITGQEYDGFLLGSNDSLMADEEKQAEISAYDRVTPEVFARHFRRLLNSWYQKDTRLFIVCDNSAYSPISFVNYYLDKFDCDLMEYAPASRFKSSYYDGASIIDMHSYGTGITKHPDFVSIADIYNKYLFSSIDITEALVHICAELKIHIDQSLAL